MKPIEIVHQGRGGYLKFAGRRFNIEHVDGGHFCISVRGKWFLPQQVVADLKKFAASQEPAWYVDE